MIPSMFNCDLFSPINDLSTINKIKSRRETLLFAYSYCLSLSGHPSLILSSFLSLYLSLSCIYIYIYIYIKLHSRELI